MPLFSETLALQRKGECLEEASAQLAELVKTCIATGKKGKLTLTLEISPMADTVSVRDEITVKQPKQERLGTTFFADDEGHLTRNNPRQAEMFDGEDKISAAN